MKSLLSAILFLIICAAFTFSNKIYYSLSEAKKEPLKVEILLLQKEKLGRLPDSLFIFENLRQLDLSKNRIDLLGQELGDLSSLEKLDLSKNEIRIIPPQIGKLTLLRELNLEKNNILELPEEIGNLTKLEVLSISGNPISELPQSLLKLTSLKTIDLRQLELPDEQVKNLHEAIPDAQILYSKKCACGI